MMAASSLHNFKGTLLIDESMAKHTSWKIGGAADKFYTPEDMDDLAAFINQLPEDENIMFLGLGSNLLVRDKGIRGTVISLKGSLSEIEVLDDNCLRVGAGTSCAKLARLCHRNNLIGGEFFAGIPGLFGGALAMNAGAFGGETWPLVKSVITIDKQGNTYTRTNKDYAINYRSVSGHKDEWFISAELQFKSGDGNEAALRVRDLLDKRAKTQPTGLPSCGSVFKNPQNDYAARLIEQCGLKGYSIGGAVVSEKHANFIINENNAKASDVENLINHVQKTVKKDQGVELQTEVKIVGEADDE
ncbi:MAG: UDP-N-acetylenolpyruvoylglucosamine reductase [endosymbiont of Galathealinum brachiosum]|uniref:UDP-N-acetylenolpyruvoylglucosamine reductase n=1 Tax=endosymbiont of Galathealinum brachiosum TaxID=2200906 RepID=A0A370D8X1_9GAMM|nr:MAG: UDP-N-acetylenolpyruvoylglucosamine reductase [endosymbiont of Galathealinum brachiosum]